MQLTVSKLNLMKLPEMLLETEHQEFIIVSKLVYHKSAL